MSYIKLKGSREHIELEPAEAKAIKRVHEDCSAPPNYPIKTETWSGNKGNIDYVVITKDEMTEKNKGNIIIKNYDDNYKKERTQILSLTPEQRGQRIGLFELLWWGATGSKEIPEDIFKKTIQIQTKFFEENPKRIFCDPILFKKFLPHKGELTIWQRGAFDIIESCVGTDMRYAHFAYAMPAISQLEISQSEKEEITTRDIDDWLEN